MARIASGLCGAAGVALLVMALFLPWLVLPVAVDEGGGLVTRDAGVTPAAKAAFLAGVVILAITGIRHLRRRGPAAALGAMLPVAVVMGTMILWFPQLVVVWDAEASGDAAWLQQQHDSLTWLGGDVYRAHGERARVGGMALNTQDPPLRLGAFRPPMARLASLGLAESQDVIWWLGYNPAFAQFAGRGWFAAVAGTVLVGLGSFGMLRGGAGLLRVRLLKRTVVLGAAAAMVTGAVALTPVLRAGSFLREARGHVLAGRFDEGAAALEAAVAALPALAFDSGVIFQRGFLDSMRGRTGTPEAALYAALRLEEEGHGGRAAATLERLRGQRHRLPRALSRELSRGLLRVAVDDLNTGRAGAAMKRLEDLCAAEPACVQGRLHLQLAALQAGDLETNRTCQRELAVLYGPFQRKEKRGVLAASWWMLAQGELERGSVARAAEARRKSKGL